MSNDGDINTRRDSEEPQAPEKLVAALKEPLARRVFVPPVVDQSILGAARKHLEKHGLEIMEEPLIAGRERFAFIDPFGNRMELLQIL